jgi:hypothetical protein
MFTRVLHFCLFALSTAVGSAAEAPATNSPVPSVGATQKEMEGLLSAVEGKQAAALAAISAALKAGAIKRPEESKYRWAVEQAYSRESGFASFSILTKQSSSGGPVPESINVALTDLQAEIKLTLARAGELAKSHADAAVSALVKIAESGTKPEELDAVDKAIAAYRELTVQHDLIRAEAGFGGIEMLAGVSRLTRAVLDGLQKKDAEIIASAFASSAGVPIVRNVLPFDIDTLKGTLRTRATSMFYAAARDSHAAVQRALIDGLSRQHVEDKIVTFQKAAMDF